MTEDDRMDEMIRNAARDYNRPPSVPKDEMWAAIEAARVSTGPRLVVAAAGAATGAVTGASPRPRGQNAFAPRFAWWGAAAAAALLVAAGIGIGRLTSLGAPVTASATDRAAAESEAALAPGGIVVVEGSGQAAFEPVPLATEAEGSRGAEPGISASRAPARRIPDVRAPRVTRVGSVAPGARSGRTAPRPGQLAAPDAAQTYQVATIRHLADAEALLTSFTLESRDERVNAQVAGWAKGLLSNTRLLLDSPAGDDPRRARLLEDLELVLAQIVQLAPAAAATERELIRGSIQNGQVMTRLRTAIPAGPTRGL